MLDALGDAAAVVAAMAQLQSAIEPEGTLDAPRPFEPGDLGWMVERHGVLYAREYGWDESFERLVARIAADFDPATDRAWIAEIDGRTRRRGPVRPRGRRPPPSCARCSSSRRPAASASARASWTRSSSTPTRGYTTLTLWTNDILHAARRIYERARLHARSSEAPHHAFGHDLDSSRPGRLPSKPWTETR